MSSPSRNTPPALSRTFWSLVAWTASGFLGGAMLGWLLGLAYGGLETLLLSDRHYLLSVGAYFSCCGAMTGGLLLGFLRCIDPEGLIATVPQRALEAVAQTEPELMPLRRKHFHRHSARALAASRRQKPSMN